MTFFWVKHHLRRCLDHNKHRSGFQGLQWHHPQTHRQKLRIKRWPGSGGSGGRWCCLGPNKGVFVALSFFLGRFLVAELDLQLLQLCFCRISGFYMVLSIEVPQRLYPARLLQDRPQFWWTHREPQLWPGRINMEKAQSSHQPLYLTSR